nr:MAG TPA: hypothetical protein [Bacteriophage sp.]
MQHIAITNCKHLVPIDSIVEYHKEIDNRKPIVYFDQESILIV